MSWVIFAEEGYSFHVEEFLSQLYCTATARDPAYASLSQTSQPSLSHTADSSSRDCGRNLGLSPPTPALPLQS